MKSAGHHAAWLLTYFLTLALKLAGVAQNGSAALHLSTCSLNANTARLNICDSIDCRPDHTPRLQNKLGGIDMADGSAGGGRTRWAPPARSDSASRALNASQHQPLTGLIKRRAPVVSQTASAYQTFTAFHGIRAGRYSAASRASGPGDPLTLAGLPPGRSSGNCQIQSTHVACAEPTS